ncbi:MAG: hypothetical protein EOP51_24530, partial [Sphingobacteriales bacterium]
MKHTYLFIRSLFAFLLLFVWAGSALAQINISIQVLPPYLYRVTDYASHPERILITIVNTTATEQRLQLRGSITGDNGIEMRVRDGYKSRTPFVMAAGEVRILNASDLTLFFDLANITYTGITQYEALRGNGFPEGNYRMCVQAFNYNTNAPMSAASPSGCSNSFGVNNLEPPVILTPRDKEEIVTNGTQLLTISWGTPPGAPPTTMYRIRLVEILGNGNPNDALMTAGQPFFETEVRGNMYIYSPADPQLTMGRRYAMMVTAFDPLELTNFRNKGQSVVTSFTYGTVQAAAVAGGGITLPAPIVIEKVVAPTIPTMSTLKGFATFAYLEEEEKEDGGSLPLSGASPIAESISYETLENTKAGSRQFPLPNAKITLHGIEINGSSSVLGTTYSRADGSYSFSFNTLTLAKCRDVYITVTHDSGQLYPITKYVKVVQNQDLSYNTDLGTLVMPIASMRLKPFIVSRTPFADGKVTIKILLTDRKYYMSPLLKLAGLAPDEERRTINRTSYVVLATLKSGSSFKKLFKIGYPDNYLVEVSANDKPTMYFPLENLVDRSPSDTTKTIGTISKNFQYN